MLWPGVAAVAATTLVLLLRYLVEGRQHLFVKRAFKHYVSPEVIDQIIANPQSFALGGERRELTIFFSDIEGFTSLSERTDPVSLTRLLNRFLSEVSAIVLSHGGTIDKYQGDAVVAFWNAPLPVEGHAYRATAAAIACHKKLRELEDVFVQECGQPLKMRIGLHTGVVSVGNFGSSFRFNYTMIGDAANLASRLEGVNKVFGSFVAISGETRVRAPEFPCRKLGEVRVVGKDSIVAVFEPMAVSELRADEVVRYEQALSLFSGGRYTESRVIFSELSTDPVSRMYVRRIDEEGDSLSSPVWNLSSK
jgi:adenylate cyclase